MIVQMVPMAMQAARMIKIIAQITSLQVRFSTKCSFCCKREPPRFTSSFSCTTIWSTIEARPPDPVAMAPAMAVKGGGATSCAQQIRQIQEPEPSIAAQGHTKIIKDQRSWRILWCEHVQARYPHKLQESRPNSLRESARLCKIPACARRSNALHRLSPDVLGKQSGRVWGRHLFLWNIFRHILAPAWFPLAKCWAKKTIAAWADLQALHPKCTPHYPKHLFHWVTHRVPLYQQISTETATLATWQHEISELISSIFVSRFCRFLEIWLDMQVQDPAEAAMKVALPVFRAPSCKFELEIAGGGCCEWSARFYRPSKCHQNAIHSNTIGSTQLQHLATNSNQQHPLQQHQKELPNLNPKCNAKVSQRVLASLASLCFCSSSPWS